MRTWQLTVKELKKAAEDIRFKPSHDIVKNLRYGIIDSGAGNGGCFNSWIFSCGDVRHVGAYCYYIIWFANHEDSFSLDQLKDMVRLWPKQPAEFAAYCGFKELWKFVQEVILAVEEVSTKKDLVELVNSLWEYSNNLNAWIYHYIPWGVFYITPAREISYYKDALAYLEKIN